MKLFTPFLLLALALSPLLGGCASSPSGGATVTPSNRLSVTLTIDKTLDPNFYYGVAFDDILDDDAGPRALEGKTANLNGVMGGNWRVLVLFHQNFTSPVIYYRSDPANRDTERRVLGTSLLFTTPRVSANSINFILNLDAQVSTGTYFFSHTSGATPVLGVDRLNVNFVATNVVIVGNEDSNGGDQRVKPVDAYETQSISVPFDLIISSTRSGTIQDAQGDVRPNVDSSFSDVNFGQMDVRQFDFSVTRTN